jgi:hypothetical protein
VQARARDGERRTARRGAARRGATHVIARDELLEGGGLAAVLVAADGRLERQRLLQRARQQRQLCARDAEPRAELVVGRAPAEARVRRCRLAPKPSSSWMWTGRRMVRDSSAIERLSACRIRQLACADNSKAARRVESLRRADQAERALLRVGRGLAVLLWQVAARAE